MAQNTKLQGQVSKMATTKYIYHSEKTKTTCEKCKSYDGKIFYAKEDIPTLPIHPNCRCYIEVVEDKRFSSNPIAECDCCERIEVMNSNIANVIENVSFILNNFEEQMSNLSFAREEGEKLLEILKNDRAILEKEVGQHIAKCKNNVDKDYEGVTDKIADVAKLNKKADELKNKLYDCKNVFIQIQKEAKDLAVDSSTIAEFGINMFYHTKSECKANEGLNKLNDKITKLCEFLNSYCEEYKEEKTQIKNTEKAIYAAIDSHNCKTERVKVPCTCASEIAIGTESMVYSLAQISEPVLHIASSNFKNSANDFSAAKKNKDTILINSIAELKDKKLSQYMIDSLKLPNNSQGVFYNCTSLESKKIWESKEMKEYMGTHAFKNNGNNKEMSIDTIHFNWRNASYDAFAGIQHCIIYNPHISEDGYFDAIIIDYYDFDYRNSQNVMQVPENSLNNAGYALQEKGYLQNYFNIYYIHEKYGSNQ